MKAELTKIQVLTGTINKVAAAPSEVVIYKGDYEVTPDVEAQTMATAQKLMVNDVTIKAIPFYDVSNTSGGTTVFIGKELEE